MTIDGGTLPRWSRDSRRIFFRNGDRFWAARMEPGAVPKVARPELLLEAQGIGSFDFDGDGNVVGLWHEPESGMVRQLDLTLNWFDELRRLVPTTPAR